MDTRHKVNVDDLVLTIEGVDACSGIACEEPSAYSKAYQDIPSLHVPVGSTLWTASNTRNDSQYPRTYINIARGVMK